MALTYDQRIRLVQQAEAAQRILMVGHVLEYHPAVVTLLQLVRSGVLGKIQYIYSNRLSLGKIRREENILWSFAPHDIAVILRLMGGMPFLRMPVPENPDPRAVELKDIRQMLDRFNSDLTRVDKTLATVKSRDVKIGLRVFKLRLDFWG